MANSHHSKLPRLQGESLSEEEFTLLIAPSFEQNSDYIMFWFMLRFCNVIRNAMSRKGLQESTILHLHLNIIHLLEKPQNNPQSNRSLLPCSEIRLAANYVLWKQTVQQIHILLLSGGIGVYSAIPSLKIWLIVE
jgi:hypothetical protein